MIRENPLSTRSIDLAIKSVEYYKWLVSVKKEYVLSKQFLRSATSIGANIHEANFAISRADFISKMHISLKEAAETEYWLIILEETGYFTSEFSSLKHKTLEIKRMLISTLKTAKRN